MAAVHTYDTHRAHWKVNQHDAMPDDLISIHLSLAANKQERTDLLNSILSSPSVPRLSIDTNKYRNGPDAASKETFRKSLITQLQRGWKGNTLTENRFLALARVLQDEGCAVFAGLIDAISFRKLIADYSNIMNDTGSAAFLHSFAHINAHPEFLKNPEYNSAIIHPLLVGLLSYVMGGPIRITDARGKDTQPISVNAQDNMLHVDNTPFRQEFKILMAWEKGQVKGPTGQNFTFLPGTHKGNRGVRIDENRQPWSTENDSLFITSESIRNVFDFQRSVTQQSQTVVEVEYPDQPVTIVFSAASLVHHRYRNKNGNPRSCIITAFHLSSDNPGSLIHQESTKPPQSVAEMLLGYQNGTEVDLFCDLIGREASAIEAKMSDIMNSDHHSELVDLKGLKLSGDKFQQWQRTATAAPTATELKFGNGHFLHHPGKSITRTDLVERLASAMAYDKHGLLDLIIYHDGHEEIRKPARKSVWTMPKEQIATILEAWLPVLQGTTFSTSDVMSPVLLQRKAQECAGAIQASYPNIDFAGSEEQARDLTEAEQRLLSTHCLILSLGESLTRIEKIETYITTNLFLFFTNSQVLSTLMSNSDAEQIKTTIAMEEIIVANCAAFLRAYIACVLLVEAEHEF